MFSKLLGKKEELSEGVGLVARFKLFSLPFEIAFLVITFVAFFGFFNFLYIPIWFFIIVFDALIIVLFKLTNIINFLFMLKSIGILFLLQCNIYSFTQDSEKSVVSIIFLVIGIIGDLLGYYSTYYTYDFYNKAKFIQGLIESKKEVKYLDVIFESLSNIFYISTMFLILELGNISTFSDIIEALFVLLFYILGITYLIFNIIATILIQFLNNNILFYILYGLKVVIGGILGVFGLLCFSSYPTGYYIWHFLIIGIAIILMIIDFVLIMIKKVKKGVFSFLSK